MHCEYCGAEIDENADVCLKCGKLCNLKEYYVTPKFNKLTAFIKTILVIYFPIVLSAIVIYTEYLVNAHVNVFFAFALIAFEILLSVIGVAVALIANKLKSCKSAVVICFVELIATLIWLVVFIIFYNFI